MNKKGFTLVELLAVIAVIALISMVAIPNIVGLSDGVKKDQMLDDAKKLISMAKYKVSKDYDIRNSDSYVFYFDDLNIIEYITKDPDGGEYIKGTTSDSSAVTYTKDENGVVTYCIFLNASKRRIGNSQNDCVIENNLYSRSNVTDK